MFTQCVAFHTFGFLVTALVEKQMFRSISKSRSVSSSRRRRRLVMEKLGDRQMMAGDCALPWTDTNLDGQVQPIDALVVINDLNRQKGAHPHDAFKSPSQWLDVNFDGWVTPHDALLVINHLNRHGSGAFELTCGNESNATLTVAQLNNGTFDTVVSNQKNVSLLAFKAGAEHADVLFTIARFQAAVGSVHDVQNYQLWVDTDGNQLVDTILDRTTARADGTIVFNDMTGGGYVIPKEESVRYEVRGDAASSFSSSQFQLAFAVREPFDGEVLADGSPLADRNFVSTDSMLFTLRKQGDLFVRKDSAPVRERQVLGGALSETLVGVDFSAEFEDADITYIGVDVIGDHRSIDRLEAYVAGETQPFAVGTSGGAKAGDDIGFNMHNRQLVVGENAVKDVVIRARMKTDENGGVSGDQFALVIDQVFARGGFSSRDLTPDVAEDLVGPTHAVVMSKISSITNANPDPDGSAIPIGFRRRVAQVKLTAAASRNTQNGTNDVVGDQLVFLGHATNVVVDAKAFRFYNADDSTSTAAATRLERLDGTPIESDTVTGVFRVVFTDLSASVVNTEIDSGSSELFVMDANILSVFGEGSSSLQFNFDVGSINWIDKDASTATRFSWVEYGDQVIPGTRYVS